MIVGVLKNFDMIFTGDLFKIASQNNAFVCKISILHKNKVAMALSKIHVSDPGPSWPFCLFHFISKHF